VVAGGAAARIPDSSMPSGALIGPRPIRIIDRLDRVDRGCRLPAVTYAFGSIRVDGDARQVSRGGGPVHLTRKALDLLLLLLEHWPSAVSKEQIHAAIWPDTFVSDASVQSLVSEIRRSLDDAAASASWIGTVHGIGYRFDGHVTGTGALPATAAAVDRPVAWLLGPAIRVPLRPGANIVGRVLDGAAEIDAPTMSRQHARITIGTSVTIEDLESKNGTWVEEVRVTGPRPLDDGARVRLGAVMLTFRLAGPPRPTEPAA
jgi:DNA-binding winged helix-turn-helix (wHTH) protein